jgi:hypothetical protein
MAAARATSARLSYLARHELGELLGSGLQDVRGFAQDSPALGGERRLPPWSCLSRSLDGPLGLGLARLRGGSEDLGGVSGIRYFIDLAGVGRDPLAADEVLGLYLGLDHGPPPR